MAAVQTPTMGRQVLTSLPLEILYYFGGLYGLLYFVLVFFIFIYKGVELPYPDGHYGMEFAYLFCWGLVEPIRLFFGSKGNKTETASPLLWNVILTAPTIALHIFYMLGQTYVLHIEQFLNGMAVAFQGLQAIIGILTLVSFQNAVTLA
mmetsp:Transcript_22428/g.37505  ORF Transcript_22428/g.37505 Transcript_22428/m.37505 type:complete len:149 (-) Transcript_22428:146-592(-)